MPRPRRLTAAERLVIISQGPYKDIKSLEDLKNYLRNNPNKHNDKLFELIERHERGEANGLDKHHCIPVFEGGPDASWNLINLSLAEHAEIHELRAEVYGNAEDANGASVLRANLARENPLETRAENARRGHATQRRLRIGFNDPAVQSELGSRNAGTSTPAREEAYDSQTSELFRAALGKPLILTNNKLKISIKCPANTCTRTSQLQDVLLEGLTPGSPEYEKIRTANQFGTGINKVIRRLVEPSYPHGRDSHLGWAVRFDSDS